MTCDLKRLYLLIVAWVWKLTMCVTHCCILFGLGPRHANSDFFSRNQQLVLARPELTLDKHEPISCCSCCSTQFHLMYVYNNETMLGVQASATSFQWIRPTRPLACDHARIIFENWAKNTATSLFLCIRFSLSAETWSNKVNIGWTY